MEESYSISPEAWLKIQIGLEKNKNWIGYDGNVLIYKENIFLFEKKSQAIDFAALCKSYEKDCFLFHATSIDDVYKNLSKVQEQNSISLTQNNTIMNEQEMSFNENQLKRSGFAEAFTADLQQKMNDGAATIQQPFIKEYDGDKVTATLHLKKSTTSDHYFLNKFDLALQKQGRTDSLNQTFYITTKKNTASEEGAPQKAKLDNRYTLKEAYNLLAGRPVHKHLVNQDGKEYDAWVKLNFDKKLDSGNYETKQYTKNYGYELESVLAHYPIKELANSEYKQSLLDSLHRGNLQKVTFTGSDGKEEKLFISPNVLFGALHVYDLNKQRIPTDTLIKKEFIGKELGENLSRLIKQNQKPDQKPEQKQEQKPEQKIKLSTVQSEKQEQKQSHKQKNDEPAKKQTRKQKLR